MHHPTHPCFLEVHRKTIQWFSLLSQWMFNTVCWILLECVLVTSAIAVTNKIADRTTVRKRLFWLTVSEWFQFLLGRLGDRSGTTKQPWDFTGGARRRKAGQNQEQRRHLKVLPNRPTSNSHYLLKVLWPSKYYKSTMECISRYNAHSFYVVECGQPEGVQWPLMYCSISKSRATSSDWVNGAVNN